MKREKTEEQRRAAAEASRRWRANHPERAKQVERDAYHRRQAKDGRESGERKKRTAEEKREQNRLKVARFRAKNREPLNALRREHYYENRERELGNANRWARDNKERQRAAYLKRRYGITPEQYDALGSVCSICGSDKGNNRVNGDGGAYRLFVDHCHDTNKVRGLLCFSCNVGIGYFNHDIALLEKAIDYLKRTA